MLGRTGLIGTGITHRQCRVLLAKTLFEPPPRWASALENTIHLVYVSQPARSSRLQPARSANVHNLPRTPNALPALPGVAPPSPPLRIHVAQPTCSASAYGHPHSTSFSSFSRASPRRTSSNGPIRPPTDSSSSFSSSASLPRGSPTRSCSSSLPP